MPETDGDPAMTDAPLADDIAAPGETPEERQESERTDWFTLGFLVTLLLLLLVMALIVLIAYSNGIET